MDTFAEYRLVERVLALGDTKSSVLLQGGFQADLRLVAADSRGAALQYFTGSKAHNIALRDRAIGLGFKLNEYGLFRVEGDEKVAGATEEDVYEALGLQWVPPELREDRGEIGAAAARQLPRLVDRADLRGDLHMHTTETDGKEDIAGMAAAARGGGLEYIAITDHSKALAMANGLDERRALAHAARIRAADGRDGLRLLAGIECDIRPDGSLDLETDCLAALDLVVASIHSAFNQDRSQMTERILRAIENPFVDILGHPTGRLILRREPYPVDIDAVLDAAARHGVARRDQLPARSAGSQRGARQARPGAGRADCDLERRAFERGARLDALGRPRRPPRLARAAARAEHAAVRGVQGAALPPRNRPHDDADQNAERRRQAGGDPPPVFQDHRQTIQEDLAKALDLLKSMNSEEERERATVYMEGLAEMYKDWIGRRTKRGTKGLGPSRSSRSGCFPRRLMTSGGGMRPRSWPGASSICFSSPKSSQTRSQAAQVSMITFPGPEVRVDLHHLAARRTRHAPLELFPIEPRRR